MPKYCLAETAVNGEIVIQENSETYTASASAVASGATFQEAAQVATVDSNTAATLAARSAVDNILLEYSYVLSDRNITSMINNSLTTTLRLLRPVFLKNIASTLDGKTFILNRDRIIMQDEYLLIPNGRKLIVDTGKFKFDNYGIISLGESRLNTTGCIGCRATNKATPATTFCTSPSNNPCCVTSASCSSGLAYLNTSSSPTNPTTSGTCNVGVGACLEIDLNITLTNYYIVTNLGCISLLGGTFQNATLTGQSPGQLLNQGTFYSYPQYS